MGVNMFASSAQAQGGAGVMARSTGISTANQESFMDKLNNVRVEFGPSRKDILNFTNQLAVMVRAGISLQEKKIIVVKSNQAHRASFTPVVAEIIDLDTPGACMVDYASLPYKLMPRPIWPVDLEMEWSPE